MYKLLRFSCLLGLLMSTAYAQQLPDIQLNGFYCCTLDQFLQEVSQKHNLQFEYEVSRFEKIEYTHNFNRKAFSTALEQVCKANRLKYYLTADGVIHVVDRWFDVEASNLAANQGYSGASEKADFKLSGRVVDTKTRESLPYVSIMIKGTRAGTRSNVDGYFSLLDVPSDTSTLVVSYLGYERLEVQLTPETPVNELVIALKEQPTTLETVTVTAEREDVLQISSRQASVIKMSPVKLKMLPNLGETDILRSFQLMPGISAANENSSGLYVRGGTPDQVLVLYDGFTVYNVEHMFGFFSTFNSNAIKDVQLFKGGFDAKYGGRLSGVVEITGKEGNQTEFDAAADISLLSVNGFVEFPIGEKVTAIFAARRSWKSPLYNKIFEQFSEESEGLGPGRFGQTATQNTTSYFYDLNGKITYRPTSKDIIALSLYNGQDNLDNSLAPRGNGRFGGGNFNIETTDLTNWGNTGASLRWSRQQSKKLFINSLASFSNYFSGRERSTSGAFNLGGTERSINRGLDEDNNLVDFTGKTDVSYQLTSHHQLETGVQLTYNDIAYSYTQNDTVSIIDRATQGLTFSAYVQDRISLFKDKVTITPGLRYNYFTPTQQHYYEPRANLWIDVTKRLRIKGAAGKYYQFARRVIREDITQGSRDFWVLSDNENLPVSSSIQYVAGLSYETPNYLFDVEAFYKDLDNVTEFSLRIEQERGSVSYSENFFTGTGLARGIEFLAQKKYGKFTGWISYTLSRTTSNIEAFGDYDFYAAQDVTHEYKQVLTYKWRNWDFGATWIYATGRPYTAAVSGYELNLLDGTTADFVNVSAKNGARFPDYHRLDVAATYNFRAGKTSTGSLGLSLFNAYNRGNVWYYEYEVVDNEVLETPVYFLGITPNLTFTLNLK